VKAAKAVNFKEAAKAAEPAKEFLTKAKEATNKAPVKAQNPSLFPRRL
jgi:hypothetical protein